MEYFAGQKLTAMDCELCMYRVFIKYCVFSLIFVIFLNSASSAAALVFYLPDVCTHTDTEGKQRKARIRNILKFLEKNTIFNEHSVVYALPLAEWPATFVLV